MEKDSPSLDTAALEAEIKSIVEKINNDSKSKPEELEEIKALIKKNVPFFTRSAFAAYILRELATGNGEGRKSEERKAVKKGPQSIKKEIKTELDSTPSHESAVQKKEERSLPEGAKTLYLNIGKMKHLYAKNLSQLLQSELGITRDDIYTLRIHDKYSFITMSEENCNKAIEKLNGKEINGRVAQINFSNR